MRIILSGGSFCKAEKPYGDATCFLGEKITPAAGYYVAGFNVTDGVTSCLESYNRAAAQYGLRMSGNSDDGYWLIPSSETDLPFRGIQEEVRARREKWKGL